MTACMHNPLGLGAGPHNPLGECSVCKKPYIEANGLHSALDAYASEFETYDFLYGLVRLLKPKVILETGCYKGGATKAMARAVKENGIGYVVTCDTNDIMVWDTITACGPFKDLVIVRQCTGVNLISKFDTPGDEVDFAFLDSSGDRVAECAALQLSPKGVVVLHDSKREQYRPIWAMRPWKTIWEIDTPRGLTVFAL